MRPLVLAALFVCATAACGLPPGEVCDDTNNPCAAGLSCVQGVCKFATCSDGLHNGNETDVDCGGNCAPCIAGGRCARGTDCASHDCVNNVCECPAGQHPSSGSCVPNSDSACGPGATDCAKAFAAGSGICHSTAGACVVASCEAGNHVCGGQCASNASPQSCGNACAPCSAPANGVAACISGSCGVACNPGYHRSGAACAADMDTACGWPATDCTKAYPNGTGACTASTGSSPASCRLVVCNAGFQPAPSGNACVSQSSSACGNPPVDCTIAPRADPHGTMTCLPGGICGVASCIKGYHANATGTACILSTDTCCSWCADCTRAVENGAGLCAVSDALPAGTCAVSTCAAGYRPDAGSNACVANSNTACGSPPADCTAIANGSGTCNVSAGVCNYSCSSGYHLYGSSCEANSDTLCGAARANCTTLYPNGVGKCDVAAGKCFLAACVSTYHNCGGSCVSSYSTSSCGSSCSPCPASTDPHGSTSCNGTSCGIACNPGYNLCGAATLCTANTASACGPNCYDCASQGDGCVGGECKCVTGCRL